MWQKDKKTFIYALIDPVTDKIRYIGKSNNPKRRIPSVNEVTYWGGLDYKTYKLVEKNKVIHTEPIK